MIMNGSAPNPQQTNQHRQIEPPLEPKVDLRNQDYQNFNKFRVGNFFFFFNEFYCVCVFTYTIIVSIKILFSKFAFSPQVKLDLKNKLMHTSFKLKSPPPTPKYLSSHTVSYLRK